MIPFPSVRLVTAVAVLSAASVGLIVFPEAWPVLLAADLAVLLAAAADLAVTPRPSALRAARLAPDRMMMPNEQRVAVRVENASRVRLWVRVRDTVPATFGLEDADLSGVVPAGGQARFEYVVTPKARGRFG